MSNDVGNRASYIYTHRSDSLDVTVTRKRNKKKYTIYEREEKKIHRTDAKPNEKKKLCVFNE